MTPGGTAGTDEGRPHTEAKKRLSRALREGRVGDMTAAQMNALAEVIEAFHPDSGVARSETGKPPVIRHLSLVEGDGAI